MNPVYETLEERGFIAQCSDDRLRTLLREQKLTIYAGFDPTADSLHLGHLVPLMALRHFQAAGHQILLVVGGATGMVGDPSGRWDERNLLTTEQVTENVIAIRKQLCQFVDFEGDSPVRILNNYDWISHMSFVDWLREVGKHITVNYMLAKDSIKRRITSQHGISFTEFSYLTIQAYGFVHLFDQFGCTVQCGGNDQWGNITAGIDLIGKLRQTQAYGLTFPLVTTSSGEKFGKTSGRAVWLDPARTSPWALYQYLVRQRDDDVIRLLKLYTFLPIDEIAELEHEMRAEPEKRNAQKTLAIEVANLVHADRTAREMAHAADVVYDHEIKGLSDAALATVFATVPSTTLTWGQLDAGIDLVELMVTSGIVSGKGKAKRLINQGGVYVNNVRVGESTRLMRQHLASESFIVLRTGKKNYHLIHVRRVDCMSQHGAMRSFFAHGPPGLVSLQMLASRPWVRARSPFDSRNSPRERNSVAGFIRERNLANSYAAKNSPTSTQT